MEKLAERARPYHGHRAFGTPLKDVQQTETVVKGADMERTLEIGEGVLVPWGMDEVPGEVVENIPPDHVLVSIFPVVESDGSVKSETLRLRASALQELPPWRPVSSRRGAPAAGADAAAAFWVTARRGKDEAKVEVRVSGTLEASQGRIPQESRQAIQTQGRSAVEKFSRQYRLPRAIVVSTHGVFPTAP